MASYNLLLLQQPDTPISERWVWLTDGIVTDNGLEQRISLASLPKRIWSMTYAFDNQSEINRQIATTFAKSNISIMVPCWPYIVKAKAPIAAAATTIMCNTSRSDFRVGKKVLIKDGSVFETAIVATVLSDRITLTLGCANPYTVHALIIPIVDSYIASSVINRAAHKEYATAAMTIREYAFMDPFIDPADAVVLTMHNSLPILERRPTGDDFGMNILTGAQFTDYGGQISIRSRWLNKKLQFSLSFNSNRIFDHMDWFYWRSFCDYCRGATNPFYMPSWWNNLITVTDAVATATTVTVTGTEYSDHFFGTFKHIVFTTETGLTHYATVTAVGLSGGNDVLTFTPALPAGDWAGQTIGFLLKCCIEDDSISIEHSGPNSVITLNLRTVP
jgi:hypothetical protein